MLPTFCRGWDLGLRTVVPLPGTVPVVDDGRPCDIAVERGAVAAPCSGPAEGPYRLTPEGLVAVVPQVGRFRCRPDAVRVEPEPAATADAVAALLIATALPAALWMRGDMVLHAAAVETGAGAVALLGASGVGKSALVDAFARRGARIIADDTVRLFAAGGAMLAAGLPACFFRREGAGRTVRPVPPALQLAAAPLGRVVELVPDLARPETASDGVAALAALLRHRHRPRVPRLLEREAVLLPRFVRLAREVSVMRWPAHRADALVDHLMRSGPV